MHLSGFTKENKEKLAKCTGLDTVNFETVALLMACRVGKTSLPQQLVVAQKDKRNDASLPWCIQYQGNGHYFETLVDAANYVLQNFRNVASLPVNYKFTSQLEKEFFGWI